MMRCTKVIDATQQKHGGIDSLRGTGQSASASSETVEPLTEGGVERVPPGRDIRRVDDTTLLGTGE
jgi:hypothetical protein